MTCPEESVKNCRRMKILVLAKCSYIYGSGMLAWLVGHYLESGLADYGTAVTEIYVLIAFRGGEKRFPHSFMEFHSKYLPSLPTTRFFRKKARMDIQYETKVADATLLEQHGFPSTYLFAKALSELAVNFHLIDSRLKKSDDFDLARFHADVSRAVSEAPRSDGDMKSLYEKLEDEQKERSAAMDPWERLGVEWDEYHPSARSLLNDPFFWSGIDSDAPHGNDSGADLLNDFKKWNKRHAELPAHKMASRLLKDWEADGMNLRMSDAAAVLSLLEEDSFTLRTADEVMIAVAFAAVKLRGCCDRETRELAMLAIERERIPEMVSKWKDAGIRRSRLDQLARTLESIPETTPLA